MDWLRQRLAGRTNTDRTSGRPPSGNGASSFHVWWEIEEPLREASAVLEVIEPPTVNRLYFFALQASFWGDKHEGGAHTGLQWNPRFPDLRAVNWGGYNRNGSILDGTTSPLPSSPNDPNTRDFAWQPNCRYRLSIGPSTEPGSWPARIQGLDTGEDILIRELSCAGDHLRSPVVWSEVFADCDHPPVAIRWSELRATAISGTLIRVSRGRVSYQSHSAGGCANTTVLADRDGFVQRSSSERTTRQDTEIIWG